MLDRMHGSKTTNDELKAFYSGTLAPYSTATCWQLTVQKCELRSKTNMRENSMPYAASRSDHARLDPSEPHWTWSAARPKPSRRHTRLLLRK